MKRYRVERHQLNRAYYRVLVVADDMAASQAHAYARGWLAGVVQAGWVRLDGGPGRLLAARDPDGVEWVLNVFDYWPGVQDDDLKYRDSDGYQLDEHGERIWPQERPDRALEERLQAARRFQ